ncbi:3'-5' exonuclease [Thauera linaloolentis]|uniref:Exonuclease RNase T and DNA polymerase III n=1 Tax=Thauera linaloolentis (strain DSM 12138 / JCM 21573 / CCUG 41526 / CIP 105981 / IAM 15112 / NBRC 102519 / 47Lol) TaxID=1123367 RepID=N6Z2C9_THAL4|nr:3'-5' exonuclease [Thauera linaloolentis]ENO88518.1 exonuclease RNase T and DNA polymerase III [Thauera linaloolentis 47Lol = DSM 12138]MCM8564905.1 3'-5' exonuclease [Thauera linaloolentis]
MSKWLSRFLSSPTNDAPLPDQAATALRRWAEQAPADTGRAHFETRYVVVNTEATGLDLEKDRLLAVAALAVDGGLLAPHDSYYGTLASHPASTLAELLGVAGKAPLIVFNAAFNRTLLEHAFDEHLGIESETLWIDLYFLLPALFPERNERPARLATWMERFGIETFQRHHALGDAWAIAQLFLAAQARASEQGAHTPRALADIERTHRQYRSRL